MFRQGSWRLQATLLVLCLVFPWGNANHEKSKYSKESNTEWDSLLRRIEARLAEYNECDHDQCRCHEAVVVSDLEPYQQIGVTQTMVEESRQHGVLYQIIDHRLYREEECMFEFRCRGVEYFLQLLKDQLADVELVVNTRDWPMVWGGRRLPVFSFSKTSEYGDITYPAWTFWQGGPAISLYPMGIGRWDQHRVSISQAAELTPWQKKRDVAFFRGSRTSSERDSLVLLGRRRPELVDAQYTRNQAWKSDADTLGAPAAKEVSFEDHCRYKYLFNFRGVAASFRFKHLFLCGSLVFHVGDEWTEFFYPQLKPWVHYIPVPSHPSEEEIVHLLEFARQNDVTVKEIAQRGRQFIMDNLRMEDVTCYWRKLLRAYTKLLKYKPEKRDELILVPERN